MTKFVHSTVVETRIFGRVSSINAVLQEDSPNPQPKYGMFKNAYNRRLNECFFKPAILDFRA